MSYTNYQSHKIPGFLTYLNDLVRYRHLCFNLVASDLRSRFRRSRLGILWAVIQPLAYSLIIAWAWGAIFKADSYWEFAVYVFSGMLVWEYFSNSIVGALEGLNNAVGYLRQSRVPFFIFQVRVPLTGLVTFLAGCVGLFLLMAVLGFLPPPGGHLLLLPAFILVLIAFMTPLAIMFSVLGTQMHDLKHIMNLSIQALFFLSPVMMKREFMDSPHLAALKFVNPMVPMLDMFRDPVVYGKLWERQDVLTIYAWIAGLWIAAMVVAIRGGRRIVFAL
ncbi:MAG: ABC transporter permease [Alphaproteobacteria bacterium]|nr:ABC transporter permease [Alphaproteobacteria bacterium]